MPHSLQLLIAVLLISWAVALIGFAALGVRYRRDRRRELVDRIGWYTTTDSDA